MKKAAHRILNVWEERSVFDELFINELRLTLGEDTSKTEAFEAKKRKIEEIVAVEDPPTVGPPEAEKLVQLVSKVFDESQEARKAETRKRISDIQSSVLDCPDVGSLKDEKEVEDLLKSANDLVQLVSEQCSHLADAVTDEEQLSSLLTASIHHNKDELEVSHQNVEETRQKLERVHGLKEDLQVHLAKLPDLSKLAPQGVAPLPAIGDLFN
jgi:DNA repair ATPase RecN